MINHTSITAVLDSRAVADMVATLQRANASERERSRIAMSDDDVERCVTDAFEGRVTDTMIRRATSLVNDAIAIAVWEGVEYDTGRYVSERDYWEACDGVNVYRQETSALMGRVLYLATVWRRALNGWALAPSTARDDERAAYRIGRCVDRIGAKLDLLALALVCHETPYWERTIKRMHARASQRRERRAMVADAFAAILASESLAREETCAHVALARKLGLTEALADRSARILAWPHAHQAVRERRALASVLSQWCGMSEARALASVRRMESSIVKRLEWSIQRGWFTVDASASLMDVITDRVGDLWQA